MSVNCLVLSYNIFKLGSRVPAERVIDRILDLQPDLLTVQEVFNTRLGVGRESRNARKLLVRRLGEAGHSSTWIATYGPGPLRALTFGKFQNGVLLAVGSRWSLNLTP